MRNDSQSHNKKANMQDRRGGRCMRGGGVGLARLCSSRPVVSSVPHIARACRTVPREPTSRVESKPRRKGTTAPVTRTTLPWCSHDELSREDCGSLSGSGGKPGKTNHPGVASLCRGKRRCLHRCRRGAGIRSLRSGSLSSSQLVQRVVLVIISIAFCVVGHRDAVTGSRSLLD
jgi:hypothetical protein